MAHASLKDKFRGCLIGQCLGDALGCPVEGWGEAACSDYLFNHVESWFKGTKPSDSWSGQYTDDSQLARELLVSLTDCKRFDPDNYASRIADIFAGNRIVGGGFACYEAAERLISGIGWKESGCAPPSAGNGTAMRAAPIGMFYYDRTEKMVEAAHLQGYITHKDPRCSAGSIAIAGAVSIVLNNENIIIGHFTNQLSQWMRPYDAEFAEWIPKLEPIIELPPAHALKIISRFGVSETFIETWPGISPFVIGSVLWSLYSFLKYPDDYWKAISTAIRIGGDVDSTGAMTGAISGAYLGHKILPRAMVEKLHDQCIWNYKQLLDLADKCFKIIGN